MCGIAGKVTLSGGEPPSIRLLKEMGQLLAHRGPDDEGFYRDNQSVGLVHKRLSILDLGGGRQPIYNEDKRIVVVVNGEIYNYKALRDELIGEGHIFASNSDSEVVVHAYEKWGDDCSSHLQGMFAFALWDKRKQVLLLSRDRLGIKPLYYALTGGLAREGIVFASEIKAILADPGVPKHLDLDSLEAYLALRYVPGPSTLLKGVFKLQPGHFLRVEHKGISVHQYWDLPLDNFQHGAFDKMDEMDQVHTMREMLSACVRSHLMADVPVGVFLSGGIDSTAVAALMVDASEGEGQVHSFSIGYPNAAKECELEYARLASDYLGTEHHEVLLDAGETGDLLPKIAWHMDEPVADPASIPLYVLAKEAGSTVKVVLSGEGADEILAGYEIYQRILALDKMRSKGGPLLGLFSAFGRRLGLPHKIYRHLERAGLPLDRAYRGISNAFTDKDRRALGFGRVCIADVLQKHFGKVSDNHALSRLLYLDTKVWLPDDLLVKADKMTMAHALELRVPFLDHLLVEHATRLSPQLKIRENKGKYLLRKAVTGLIPEAIIHRRKKGFPIPISQWLKDGRLLGDYARDRLFATKSICRDLFPASPIRRMMNNHMGGLEDRSAELWALLTLDAWYQVLVDGDGARPSP